jgi:hypothetical protein
VIARLLSQAKRAIDAGELREGGAAMSIAYEVYGASQQEIATAVGKSQGWASRMLQWRRKGFNGTSFGQASRHARMRARIRRWTRLPRRRNPWRRCK